MEEVIREYKKFAEYLDSVDVSRLKETNSIEDIEGYIQEVESVRIKSIGSELRGLVKQMKEEKYSELKGVHRFPILNDIKFLSEQTKIKLDEFLMVLGKAFVGERLLVRHLGDKTKANNLIRWLKENDVIEEHYYVYCGLCKTDTLGRITRDEKKYIEHILKNYEETGEWQYVEGIENILQDYCGMCDALLLDDMVEEGLDGFYFEEVYQMKIKAETVWDTI